MKSEDDSNPMGLLLLIGLVIITIIIVIIVVVLKKIKDKEDNKPSKSSSNGPSKTEDKEFTNIATAKEKNQDYDELES